MTEGDASQNEISTAAGGGAATRQEAVPLELSHRVGALDYFPLYGRGVQPFVSNQSRDTVAVTSRHAGQPTSRAPLDAFAVPEQMSREFCLRECSSRCLFSLILYIREHAQGRIICENVQCCFWFQNLVNTSEN